MKVQVESEIGALERVLVHRPGADVARMTHHDLGKLLFDDILSPEEAAREHELLCGLLAGAGAEVLELREELQRALESAPEAARRELLEAACSEAGAPGLAEPLLDWPAERLARGLIDGVSWSDVPAARPSLPRIRAGLFDSRELALKPQPNLMFMRDPCFAVQDRVVVSRMAQGARAREPWLVAFALEWGGSLQDVACLRAEVQAKGLGPQSYEGGDFLVLSPEVVLVGCSERTTASAIERLLEEVLFPALPGLQRAHAVLMPEARQVMHLDTIVTQVDRELFLGHRPHVAGQGDIAPLSVVRLERGRPPELNERASLLTVLRDELGSSVRLVSCGGEDPVHQEREQWTDGANAVCLSPGRIILYSRNVHTIRELEALGFEEVRLHVAQPEKVRAELLAKGLARERVVFSFSGSELSRARGGGRCLTMPLRRGAIG